MDMNAIDIGTLLAIAGLIYKTTQDKIVQAEAMGRLKQQVTNLETKPPKLIPSLKVLMISCKVCLKG